MRKFTLFILTVAVLTVLSGFSCLADAPDSSYVMVLNDEFTGTELNTDIWAYRTGNPYGGKNLQENVRVSDGKLYLDYRKVGGYYTGGGVLTLANLPYGYYETKAKVYTGANGFHTSFWTSGGSSMSHKSPYHPQNTSVLEIDGFEFDSNQTTTAPKPAYNLHYWWADHESIGGATYDCDTDGSASTSDWFTMGIEWLPGKIIFYCNGEQVGTMSPEVYNPSALWLSAVAMPDNYKNSNGTYNIDDTKMDANGYFGSSEYEYFRYYNKKLKGVNLLGNGHFELNRQESLSVPRAFYSTGTVKPVSTPFAHGGIYAIQMLQGSTTGQELQYLASGKYTFEGYFKTKENTTARLVVYGKDGSELKSLSIPACEDWTKVSMTDIAVETYAYVVVEVAEGDMMADDLSFYCQEGETGYESYKDTNYEKYAAFKSAASSPVIIPASEATKSDSGWSTSTHTGMSNLYVHAYRSSTNKNYYKNIYANWEYTFTEDEAFDVEIYQIIDEGNIASQNYTVTLDGVNVAENVSVKTKDGSTVAGQWVKLCDVNGKEGQVLKVSMSLPAPSSSREYARITPVRLFGHDEKFMDSALVAQLAKPIFQYKNMLYAFNLTNSELYPYKSNDVVYIPYQAIKSFIPISGVDENAQYVSETQINASGVYTVTKSGSYIMIHERIYTPSKNAISAAISNLNSHQDDFGYITSKATHVGTANASNQEVYDITKADLTSGWETSSLGYGSNSRYGSGGVTAFWELTPKYTGRYSVQFYSIVHAGGNDGSSPSTTSAGVELTVLGNTYTYRLNQCVGSQGWYDLGEFDLLSGDSLFINLYNAAGSGLLRANAVRLVPTFGIPEFVNNTNALIQEYFGPEEAKKSGAWAYSSDEYAGCMYAEHTEDNKDASITWSAYPSTDDTYSIQIYIPRFTEFATSYAAIDLDINGNVQRYFIDERAESEENTGTGWYTLGDFALTTTDLVSVTMSNHAQEQCLRAKAIRLIPQNAKPVLVGNFDESNQEVHAYSTATRTGAWYSSGVVPGLTTYYGNGSNATITWKPVPKATQKYSIQVYIPTYTEGSTTNAYITLTIDGVSHTFSGINQHLNPTVWAGWYDLGVFYLSPSSEITVTMGMNTGYNIRAKDMRLVPFPSTVTVTESSGAITAKLGTISNYAKTVIFAEYDSNGVKQSAQILDAAPTLNITMENADNDYKIFFWRNIHTMIPIIPAIEK